MSEFSGFTSTAAAVSIRGDNAEPNGWRSVKSGEIFEFNNGKAFYSDGYSNEGYRVIDLLNIDRAGKFQITKKDKFVSEEVYEKYPKAHLIENDLIIIMTDITPSLGLIGKTAVIDKSNTYVLNQRVGCLRPKNDNASIKFMNYMFNSDVIRLQVITNTLGTAQFYVNTPVLRNLDVPFPPLPEQQKIAQILTSVDEVIEKTQAQIDKLKDLKTGMMQELLTKGIGHVEFKDSPVGIIPVGWEVKPLEELCSLVGVGIASSTTHAYTDIGVALLRNQNILRDGIRKTDMLYITKEFSEQNSSKKIYKRDVISIRTGYPGVSAVVPDEFDGCHSFTTLISRPNESLLNSDYLALLINSDYGQNFVTGGQAGGAQQNLNSSVLKVLPVILPPIEEQKAIFNAIEAISIKLRLIIERKNKIQATKKALMQDLLTGKVRVNTEQSNTALTVG